MKSRKTLVTTITFTLLSFFAKATTWDEPWMDKVIQNADSFILGKISHNDTKKGFDVKVIKRLGGATLPGEFKVDGFSMLHLCSLSGGEGPEFNFDKVDSCYLFIKKNTEGHYCIATPTTGFAIVSNSLVSATYRHSYHQARVPATIYEKSMVAIFNHYHNLPFDNQYINNFVNQHLNKKPALINQAGMDLFFKQHVALECVYHLRLVGHEQQLKAFIKDTSNMHAQISAARALGVYNTASSKALLLGVIDNNRENQFVQVMAVWSLAAFKPKELKQRLVRIEKTASDEENGFGGNIMDPRVCTHLPTTKKAISDLVKTL